MIRVGSICSGIEAASQAAPDNWEFSFFSEIEKFPSAVLAHHYPDTPNLGDFTSIKAADWPDVTLLCGGPPCQTFSIAGNRDGLNDERGNLTLDYVRMMHDFADNGLIWGLYENVPGILSDRTNAFGYFLSGIVGGDAPLCPPDAEWGEWNHDPLWVEVGRDKNDNPIREEAASCGGTYGWKSIRWPSQGMVEGPRARAAWDILDAQWFGLAQRRKRVFVVISFADDRDPAKVLFERKGVLGNTPPSRETGQGLARNAMAGAGNGSHWSGSELHPSLNQSNSTSGIGASNQEIFSQGGAGLVPERASVLTERPLPQSDTVGALTDGAHNGGGLNGQDAYTGRIFPVAFSSKNHGQDASYDLSPVLRAGSHDKSHANAGVPPAIAFKHSHYTRGKDGKPSEIMPPLTADADKGDQDAVVLASTYTLDIRGRNGERELEFRDDETANSLRASSGGRDGMGAGAVAYGFENRQRGDDGRGYDRPPHFTEEIGPTVNTVKQPSVVSDYAVRRLTPVECERLMGFPDNFTLIDYTRRASELKLAADVEKYAIRMGYDTQDENVIRQFMCPDGPRYKALGNSWAVPVVKWIFDRVELQEAALRAAS